MSPRAALVLVVLALVVGMRAGVWLALANDPVCQGVSVVQLRAPRLLVQIPVTVTAYSSTPDQTDASPDVAAWGDNVWRLQGIGTPAVAVSRDLEPWLRPGSTVHLVADRMHERWERRIDLWFASRGEAVRWGVRRGVLVVEP